MKVYENVSLIKRRLFAIKTDAISARIDAYVIMAHRLCLHVGVVASTIILAIDTTFAVRIST